MASHTLLLPDFFGGNSGGFLRSKTDLNNRPLVTRFPRQNLAQAVNETLASGVFDGPVGTMLNVTGGGGGDAANGTGGGAMLSTQTDDELPFGSQEALEFEADYLFNDVRRLHGDTLGGDGIACGLPPATPHSRWTQCRPLLSAPNAAQEGRVTFVYPPENYER